MDVYTLLKKRFGDGVVKRGDEVTFSCYKCHDSKGHFYFNVALERGHCFLCGYKVNLVGLLKDLAFVGKVEKVVKKQEVVRISKVRLPWGFRRFAYGGKVPRVFHDFVLERRLSWIDLIERQCGYCSFGFYGGRIVVPVYEDGELKSFVARDVTGRARLKYLYPKFSKISDLLYNLETAKKQGKCVLVEGVFDCFRIGDLGVAIFGKTLSKVQEEKLFLSNFKSVCVMLDADARRESWVVASKVSRFVRGVSVVELPKGDPCDYSRGELGGFVGKAKPFTLKYVVVSRFGV